MVTNKIHTNALLVFCVASFLFFLSGCVLNYEDISTNPEYRAVINNSYSLKKDMLIYGINIESGYGKKINIYEILPMSMRITGPEIISEDTLPSGTLIEVKKILRSVNAVPFEGRRVRAVVEVTSYKKAVNVPIEIDMEYILSNQYVEDKEGGNLK